MFLDKNNEEVLTVRSGKRNSESSLFEDLKEGLQEAINIEKEASERKK